MKQLFILLMVLVAGSAAAQSQPSTQVSLVSNVSPAKKLDKRAIDISAYGNDHKAVFTYRGNFVTHHDTVIYLRDTILYRRAFSLIQMPDGEIRRVPAGSIRPLNAPRNIPAAYYSNN